MTGIRYDGTGALRGPDGNTGDADGDPGHPDGNPGHADRDTGHTNGHRQSRGDPVTHGHRDTGDADSHISPGHRDTDGDRNSGHADRDLDGDSYRDAGDADRDTGHPGTEPRRPVTPEPTKASTVSVLPDTGQGPDGGSGSSTFVIVLGAMSLLAVAAVTMRQRRHS